MDKWLKDKKTILLVSHVAPDGDALGSVWGMAWILEEMGKKPIPYVQEIPDNYAPFAHPDTIVGDIDMTTAIDGIISLDCANVARLYTPFKDWESRPKVPVLNIDHHATNENYGNKNEIWPKNAATCEIVAFEFDEYLSQQSATALYMGILTDTGGFKFSNVSEHTYYCAANLMAEGAAHDKLVENLYFSKPQGQIDFESHVMSNVVYHYEGQLIFGLMKMSDFDKFGVKPSQMEESTQKLREVKGVRAAIRLIECDEGIRISLRSKDKKVDVSEIAKKFDGGGHPMASGAFIEGVSLTTAMERIAAAFDGAF